jgi:hypothetical protein
MGDKLGVMTSLHFRPVNLTLGAQKKDLATAFDFSMQKIVLDPIPRSVKISRCDHNAPIVLDSEASYYTCIENKQSASSLEKTGAQQCCEVSLVLTESASKDSVRVENADCMDPVLRMHTLEKCALIIH